MFYSLPDVNAFLIFLLQDVAYGLKNEIASQLLTLNVSSFSMAPVKVCESIIHMSAKCMLMSFTAAFH